MKYNLNIAMTTAVLVRSVCTGTNSVCTGTNSVVNLIGSNFRIGAHSFQPLKHTQGRFKATKADVDKTLNEYYEGKFETLPDPDQLTHFRRTKADVVLHDVEVPTQVAFPMGAFALPHPIWSENEVHGVQITHKPPEGFVDKAAFLTVTTARRAFDVLSGFTRGERNEYKWLKRIIFLETVAAVPGMVAAMTRHLHSLRRMQRDYGWIHTLLEEAENERMHLMTALQLGHPSRLFKWSVIGTQGVFVGMFCVCYMVSPKFCHRFVGYLEEEAVKTYTKCLQDIESGSLEHWNTEPSPEVAITYWNLPEDATMKDVILAIRADEAHHRLVNHTLASMKPTDYNPYKPGQ